MRLQLNRTQALMFGVIMGSLSLAIQLFVPGIPVGLGKIDLALVPAIVGAVFGGPMAGVIIGLLHGIGSPAYIALIPSSVFSFTLIAFLAMKLKMRWGTPIAIVVGRILIGTVVATLIFQPLVYTSAPLLSVYIIGLSYNIPSSIIAIIICSLVEKRFLTVFGRSEPVTK